MSGAAAPLAVALLLVAGCGGDSPSAEPAEPTPPPERSRAQSPVPLESARCPAELADCRTASGRIIFVERVDPDGDGDAHFVLASPAGVTAAGITVIDVRRDLRPQPLPGIGDQISAAGPVVTGSYGQRQIQATELHVARRRR